MDPIRQRQILLTRRQLFGRTAVGIGTAGLASLLNPRVFAAEGSLFTLTMMISNLGVGRAIDLHDATPFDMARAMGVISLIAGACWVGGLAWRGKRSGGAMEKGRE